MMTKICGTTAFVLVLLQSHFVLSQPDSSTRETTEESITETATGGTTEKTSKGTGKTDVGTSAGSTGEPITTEAAGTDVTTEEPGDGATTATDTAGVTTESGGTDTVTNTTQATNETSAGTSATTNVPTTSEGPLVILPEEVVLQACCDKHCTNYTSPLELFGLKCCGQHPFNLFNEICCNGSVHSRQRANYYYEECCGNEPLAYDQSCCQGRVFDVAGQMCCGPQPYNMYDEGQLCCNDKLHRLRPGDNAACCGQEQYDGGVKEFCCGDKVYQRNLFDSCCLKETVDGKTGKTIVSGEGFKSADAFCCNGVQKFNSKEKFDLCCYIFNDKTGKWDMEPYNSKKQCCDYSGIKDKDKNGKCPSKS